MRFLLLSGVLLGLAGAACDRSPQLEGATVPVGCARCVFGMEGFKSCPWAVKIDGKPYLVQGPLPKDHSTHAPDGICNMEREAVVDGRLEGDRFVATRFELLPAKNVPEKPRFTTDAH